MTALLLTLYASVHLYAWGALFGQVTPRRRLLLALVLPPLVALHWWERSMENEDARERKRALFVVLAWLATLLLYVGWISVT